MAACSVLESTVINAPIERVWELVRPVNFSFLNSVKECHMENRSDSWGVVGGTRVVEYLDADKTVQKLKLEELSDLQHYVTYSMTESEPPVDVMSVAHTIRCRPVTDNNTCFVQFLSEYTNDATQAVLQDSKYKKIDFLKALDRASRSAFHRLIENRKQQLASVRPQPPQPKQVSSREQLASARLQPPQPKTQEQLSSREQLASSQLKPQDARLQPQPKSQEEISSREKPSIPSPSNPLEQAGTPQTKPLTSTAPTEPAKTSATVPVSQPLKTTETPRTTAADIAASKPSERGEGATIPVSHVDMTGMSRGPVIDIAKPSERREESTHPLSEIPPIKPPEIREEIQKPPEVQTQAPQPEVSSHIDTKYVNIFSPEAGPSNIPVRSHVSHRLIQGAPIGMTSARPPQSFSSRMARRQTLRQSRLEMEKELHTPHPPHNLELLDLSALQWMSMKKVDEVWDQFDTNKDGKLTPAEGVHLAEALIQRLAEEQNEIIHAVNKMFYQPEQSTETWSPAERDFTKELVDDLRKNEMPLAAELMGRLDTNRDGAVSKAEFESIFPKWLKEKTYTMIRGSFR